MRVIKVRNGHEALPLSLEILAREGVREDSRNGPVVRHPEPVATVYEKPQERVVFHEWRDANPFFFFYESLWMLAGRRDVAPLVKYAKQLGQYSDDGVTQNAAYGYRWRQAELKPYLKYEGDGAYSVGHYERDQLTDIVNLLRKNPRDRQCVLQIWDHRYDLGTTTKDHACNLVATFQLSTGGHLDMVVCCRSNDLIWGCNGANLVHFSVLHEYVAAHAGLPLGIYTQVSVNWHAYEPLFSKTRDAARNDQSQEPVFKDLPLGVGRGANPYRDDTVAPHPLVSPGVSQEEWDRDVRAFVTDSGCLPGEAHYKDPFFTDVAWPIVQAHDIFKFYESTMGEERFDAAIDALTKCRASDWRLACTRWLERRRKPKEAPYEGREHL